MLFLANCNGDLRDSTGEYVGRDRTGIVQDIWEVGISSRPASWPNETRPLRFQTIATWVLLSSTSMDFAGSARAGDVGEYFARHQDLLAFVSDLGRHIHLGQETSKSKLEIERL